MADKSVQDDKARYAVPFILEQLAAHQTRHPEPNPPPFFIGLNGVQGAGKSVLVSILRNVLSSPPHNLSTVVFSLDDLYLTHQDQQTLARKNPSNPLLQHRGQPSTHDVDLALEVFQSLKENQPTRIPQYDKSAFQGQGDRVPKEAWEEVNKDTTDTTCKQPIQVVLFEGWCVGFRSLSPERLEEKHTRAQERASEISENGQVSEYKGRLGHNSLESVTTINDALRAYDVITDQLDAFIHLDAGDPQYVYKWRLQQEEGLRASKGNGMTDEQVKHFVDGYYPAYELYTETLREGVFKPAVVGDVPTSCCSDDGLGWQGKQLRLVVGFDRRVTQVIKT